MKNMDKHKINQMIVVAVFFCLTVFYMTGRNAWAECILRYSYSASSWTSGYSGSERFSSCSECQQKVEELSEEYFNFSGSCRESSNNTYKSSAAQQAAQQAIQQAEQKAAQQAAEQAAQKAAAQKAAEEAAAQQAAQQAAAQRAEEERRSEYLRQKAKEARAKWESQDAADLKNFSDMLSSKKTGNSGMSSLLQKQASQQAEASNTPNVVKEHDVSMAQTAHQTKVVEPVKSLHIAVPVLSGNDYIRNNVIEDKETPTIKIMSFPDAIEIIGVVGKNIEEIPAKFLDTAASLVGKEKHLNIIKLAKGLSKEAGESMNKAVDLIDRGCPEEETKEFVNNSEARVMKICIENLSDIPVPEDSDELQKKAKKLFNWLSEPIGKKDGGEGK